MRSKEYFEDLKALGADEVIDTSSEDVPKRVKEITGACPGDTHASPSIDSGTERHRTLHPCQRRQQIVRVLGPRQSVEMGAGVALSVSTLPVKTTGVLSHISMSGGPATVLKKHNAAYSASTTVSSGYSASLQAARERGQQLTPLAATLPRRSRRACATTANCSSTAPWSA